MLRRQRLQAFIKTGTDATKPADAPKEAAKE